MFFASLKVQILDAAVPDFVGTGTEPQLTLPLYVATAHGPTIAMAATPSAKASPAYASWPASLSLYMVDQNWATSRAAALSNVAFLLSISSLPPVCAAY